MPKLLPGCRLAIILSRTMNYLFLNKTTMFISVDKREVVRDWGLQIISRNALGWLIFLSVLEHEHSLGWCVYACVIFYSYKSPLMEKMQSPQLSLTDLFLTTSFSCSPALQVCPNTHNL